MLSIDTYTGGVAMTNGYACRLEDASFVVDAPEGMMSWLEKMGFEPAALLLTHAHFDHVWDAAVIRERWGCPIFAYTHPQPDLTLESLYGAFGPALRVKPYVVDHLLEKRESFELGEVRFRVLHIPGHSPDSIALLPEGTGTLFGGDALFRDGIGRDDLPGCDGELLRRAIREKLYVLEDDLRVLPGHGPSTTIGRERRTNPFV